MKRTALAAGLPLMIYAMTAASALAGNEYLPSPCNHLALIPTWGILSSAGVDCFVGTDPRLTQTTTEIVTPVIPVILQFLDETGAVAGTADPNAPMYSNPKLSALGAVLASPIFQPLDFKLGGTDIGSVQWLEATERASFWNLPTANFKNWHVNMIPMPMPPLTILVPFGMWTPGIAAHAYRVDAGFMGLALIGPKAVQDPKTLPIFLLYNIGEYAAGNPDRCCTNGVHSAALQDGIYHQFSITASYSDSTGAVALSHEIAEFGQDPFADSPVAPYPHSSGFKLPWNPPYTFMSCRSNLEVGDPLEDRTGSEEQLLLTNSTMTYTFQNVVTASWLMQASPSFSVNGWYTLKGAVDGEFSAPAPACPGTLK
jgi:hypothetical protein